MDTRTSSKILQEQVEFELRVKLKALTAEEACDKAFGHRGNVEQVFVTDTREELGGESMVRLTGGGWKRD
jgi:hypothetical protein